ncbi:MAG: NUDIX domain-containing protein, partial [Chloroflexota bacterium]|nr:NUDIX domain-containing protein [Chloroflexota bacterium]
TRAAIHLDGDWHQAFHCWIVRDGPQVVLQRRSTAKDTFGGFWDAAAAGHWRFGESAPEAAREIAEELGIEVAFADLRYRGRERLARAFANGLIDREHHQVYLLRLDAPLVEYRPDPSEVSALAAFDVGELLAVVRRQRATLAAREAVTVDEDGRMAPAAFEVGRAELVPYSAARLRRTLE